MTYETILRKDHILRLSSGRRLSYTEMATRTANRSSSFTALPVAGFTGNFFLGFFFGLTYILLRRTGPDMVSRTGRPVAQ